MYPRMGSIVPRLMCVGGRICKKLGCGSTFVPELTAVVGCWKNGRRKTVGELVLARFLNQRKNAARTQTQTSCLPPPPSHKDPAASHHALPRTTTQHTQNCRVASSPRHPPSRRKAHHTSRTANHARWASACFAASAERGQLQQQRQQQQQQRQQAGGRTARVSGPRWEP